MILNILYCSGSPYCTYARLDFILYLRLVFPTLQQNSSPLSVMTAFMETLGRKIDQADREKAGIFLPRVHNNQYISHFVST